MTNYLERKAEKIISLLTRTIRLNSSENLNREWLDYHLDKVIKQHL